MIDALKAKLNRGPGPKRILALDGGGIRGLVTLGMLESIEAKLQEQSNGAIKTLSDHYDLMIGTSTGAIIASGLALGMSVEEITKHYLALGDKIFGDGMKYKFIKRSSKTLRALFNENYDSTKLEEYLKSVLSEVHISDQTKLKCGLAINMKRADTFSLWTVANHPAAKYAQANAHLKVWELCRASSAAPYYFKPKKLSLRKRSGEGFEAAFVDGGVSLANNPAWQGFLVATVPSFGFNWEHGEDKILITSLGTGGGIPKANPDSLVKRKALMWASTLPELFMTDANELNFILLQSFGLNKGKIYINDSQFQDLPSVSYLKDKLFTFVRHNVEMSQTGLAEIGIEADEAKVKSLVEMDHHENMQYLLAIGRAYALTQINEVL
jgi:hypothetical protein